MASSNPNLGSNTQNINDGHVIMTTSDVARKGHGGPRMSQFGVQTKKISARSARSIVLPHFHSSGAISDCDG